MSERNRTGKFYVKKLFSGSLAMTLSEATMKIAKFLVLPILTYYLSPRDFGIIASIKMVEGFLVMLYNPGMISGVTRKYYDTEDEKERKTYIGSALLFFFIISITTCTILLLFGSSFFKTIFSEFEFYPYGIFAILISILIQPKRLWSSLMTFQFKVPKVAWFSLLQMFIDVGLSLFLISVLLFGVEGRIFALIAGVVFISIVSIVYLLEYIRGNFSFKVAWKLFIFGLPLAPAIWAYTALEIADRFLIERYVGLEQLGLYSIGYTMSSVPLFLSLGLRKMWNPIFYENMNQVKYHRIDVLIKYFVLGMALSSGLLIMFSPEIITIVLAEQFEKSIIIIPWVCSGVFFLGILPITSSFISFEKNFSQISINAGISAVINIIMNIILLPKIGIVGSAISTMIAYIIYFILNIFNCSKIFAKVVSKEHIIIPIFFIIISVLTFYIFELSILHFMLKIIIVVCFFIISYITGFFTIKELKKLKELVKIK